MIEPNSSKIELDSDLLNGESSKTGQLWTVREVAQYLQLKPNTVRAMARRGELPVLKVGRVWRFDPKLIEQWVNNETRKHLSSFVSD